MAQVCPGPGRKDSSLLGVDLPVLPLDPHGYIPGCVSSHMRSGWVG